MDVASLHQQIGRLSQIVETKESALSNLHGQVQAYMQECDGLRKDLSSKSRRIEHNEAEIEHLKNLLKDKDGQIGELGEKVRKMQTTIKVQSDQISSKPVASSTTPQRKGSTQQTFQHDALASQNTGQAKLYTQPPPIYNVRPSQQTSTFIPPTLHHQRSSNIAASALNPRAIYTPPLSLNQKAPSMPTYGAPTHPLQQGKIDSYGALVVRNAETDDFDFPSDITRLYKLVEEWTRNYANLPNAQRDTVLPSKLVKALDSAAHPSATPGLLSSGSTRYLLVARYLNEFLEKNILKIKVIKGFSPSHENILKKLKSDLQPEMSIHSRRASMQAMCDTIIEIGEISEFQEWLKHQAYKCGEFVRSSLDPLLAPGADQAWEDLHYVILEAHRIGYRMQTKPYTYVFEYPGAHPTSWFNPALMVNRDRDINGDPVSLQRAQRHIRLAISPIVVYTDVMSTSIMPKTVHMAEVVLDKW